jgi:hypothetical protein
MASLSRSIINVAVLLAFCISTTFATADEDEAPPLLKITKTVNVYERWVDARDFRDKPEGLPLFFVHSEVAPGVLVVSFIEPDFERDWELRVRVGDSPAASVRSAEIRAGKASREVLLVPYDEADRIHIEGTGDVPSVELTSATQTQDVNTNLKIFGPLNVTSLLDEDSQSAKAIARLTYVSDTGIFASCSVWHIGNGYFLTNNHCVENKGKRKHRDITINLGDVINAPVKAFPEVRVRGGNRSQYRLNERLDYALMHVEDMPKDFASSAFEFAKSNGSLIGNEDALDAFSPGNLRVYQYFAARGKRGLFRAEDPNNCRITQQTCNSVAFGHKCDTEAESSGGAVTDQNDRVIGLHYGTTGSRNCAIYAGQIYSHLETHHSGAEFWPEVKLLFNE